MPRRFRTSLGERRRRAGLQQQELASLAGVSRQTISAIETGETVPSTEIALDLARALGCKVEDVFAVSDPDDTVEALVVGSAARRGRPRGPVRVALGMIGDRWVAHPLGACSQRPAATAADGLAAAFHAPTAKVRLLRAREAVRRNLLVAGCDPAIGLLADHLAERGHGPLVRWLPLGGGAALDALAEGHIHVAGLHLSSHDRDPSNTVEVQRRLPGRAITIVNLASWEQGLVCAPGNPLGLAKVADLARAGVRVVRREPGSGAQRLLERHLDDVRIPLPALVVSATARGHLEVAQAVAFGLADAGVATREAADAFGLAFAPLETARFDLAIPEELTGEPLLQPLLATLAGATFRRELRALAGYETRRTGEVVARLTP